MEEGQGQKELLAQVINQDLCTGCGACVSLCPYLVIYQDRTVALHKCDLKEGNCYGFCPRTGIDLAGLRKLLYQEGDMTPELGSVKGYYLARATDNEVRKTAQHGGAVTTLMRLALKEGFIDAAVVSEGVERFLQQGVTVTEPEEIKKRGKSKFIVSPTVAEFNRAAGGSAQRIGVVATPCQALALAKMRLADQAAADSPILKLSLTIGLFCGWTLSWRDFVKLLQTKTGIESVTGMDIPPRKEKLEIHTEKGTIELDMEEVRPIVRPACDYCFDTTAEFSDISVGSARLPEEWNEAKTWNQVIVRSDRGEELLTLARDRGLLEFRPSPAGAFEELKLAARKKKETALKNLMGKSGSPDRLIYLDRRDPVICSLMDS